MHHLAVCCCPSYQNGFERSFEELPRRTQYGVMVEGGKVPACRTSAQLLGSAAYSANRCIAGEKLSYDHQIEITDLFREIRT
jgi:hypothetical protein